MVSLMATTAWASRGCSAMSPNWSIDADPQRQAAALPLMLVVRSFLR